MANLEDKNGVPLWVRLCTQVSCVWQGTERVDDALGRLYGATMVQHGESWLNDDGPDYTRVGERLVVETRADDARIYDIGPRPMAGAQRGTILDISPLRANSETGPPPFRRKKTLDLVKERISLGPRISLLMVNNVDDVVALLCEQVDELWRVLDGADEEAG